MMEFHVARKARDRYQFDEALFGQSGNVIFANFHAARVFAQKMNAKRDLSTFPEQVVRAGQINAMGLIDEILHLVMAQYRQQKNPDVLAKAIQWLYAAIGEEAVHKALKVFVEEFPPLAVYQRSLTIDEWLNGQTTLPETGGVVSNRQIALEEMIMLWLANANPAFSPFLELFDDARLDTETAYPTIVAGLHDFFETQPRFGPDNQNLIDMLRAPALASPHSLEGQLDFIRQRWYVLLGKFLYRLLSSLDLIKEEAKAFLGGGLGPGPARVYEFRGQELEPERFSPDKDWMPNLVLMAKNAYVWLDQLSKKHHRAITTLDQIPDEELDALSRWGFTGLWLIGLWERSAASKRIKQLRGNPEAVASAYSLFDYQIAGDLGGEASYRNLHDRAWQRGIRLASDMVPNHMGIDSRWVIEHPDWFIALDYSPYPSYSFNGPNLSWDDRVGLYIEDHYFNNTDAAVVFKRVDNWSGNAKYIYHGNDGTSMPWNDTAQLNYLKAEVREAVIQTILSVARKFPVIRFDAAMTLAKKHFQRLWFPEPGTGGAIPSRSDHGLTKEQFDALMPVEFWREVVDRVAQEVPDTLLLAEAFWLMEGYFVRTLGMHRVYNSAFMNMMRDEKNAEYRLVMKNTLEFDPEILKRYVNFMNNPDERTAVDQFGKGDKYFGIATMMSTLPGLPMFGHGQIEGFTEKYGMEYRKAYWEETPDQWLVDRHIHDVFPLLRKRYLFAEVKDFLLYDFYAPEGHVNEDVFAYSNRRGDERSLVLYHNKYATAVGWVRSSAAYSVKSDSGERRLVQRSLAEGLGLPADPNCYVIFRDEWTNLEYIRNCQEIASNGLYVELEAYKCHVFLDFRLVQDNEWQQYSQLAGYLNGRGVPNIDEAIKEIFLQPIHDPYRELVNEGWFHWIMDNRLKPDEVENTNLEAVLDEAEAKTTILMDEIKRLTRARSDSAPSSEIAQDVRQKLAAILELNVLDQSYPLGRSRKYKAARQFLSPLAEDGQLTWGTLLCWLFSSELGRAVTPADADEAAWGDVSRSWIDEWLLGKMMATTLQDMGAGEGQAWRAINLVKLLTRHSSWCKPAKKAKDTPFLILKAWLADSEVQQYLGVNRYQGLLWFNKESFEDLLWWMYTLAVIEIIAEQDQQTTKESVAQAIIDCYAVVEKMLQAEAASDYQVEKLVAGAKV